jgi:SPP1 family predicted phage head-tail adaptor
MSLVTGIDPGRLKKKVDIYRYKEVADEDGNATNVLAYYKTVHAEIRPTRGDERKEYFAVYGEQTYKVTMRWCDLRSDDVIIYNSKRGRLQLKVTGTPSDVLEDHYIIEAWCTLYENHEAKEEEDDG